MKNTRMLYVGLIVAVSASVLQAQNCMNGRGGCVGPGGIATTSAEPLSQKEQDALTDMLAEEKLAHDVYVSLAKATSLPIFTNISKAELRHQNALQQLAIRYAVKVPSTNEQVGVFEDAKFQTLYDSLVKKGKQSGAEAAKVGAKIEELDIVDLREAIAASNHEDVKLVYGNLERASRNHLRAYANSIRMLGGTYTSEHLSQEEFDRIANAAMEPGGGGARMGAGRGPGRGPGRGKGWGRGNGRRQSF